MTDIFTTSDAQFIKSELTRDLKAVTDRHEKQFLEVIRELGLHEEVVGVALAVRIDFYSDSDPSLRRARLIDVCFDWRRSDVVAIYRTEIGANVSLTPEDLALAIEEGRIKPA